MRLPVTPEPAEFKQEVQLYRHKQKYPDMSYDTLYIRLVKSFPSYLWKKCRSGEVLKKEGIRWQKFQSILSRAPLKQWLRNQRTWDDIIRGIRDKIEKRIPSNGRIT